jgi:hypothetical protein
LPAAVAKKATRKKAQTALPGTAVVSEVATPTVAAPVAKPAKPGKAQTVHSATAPWPFPTYSKP